jgi:hypothetical protein
MPNDLGYDPGGFEEALNRDGRTVASTDCLGAIWPAPSLNRIAAGGANGY